VVEALAATGWQPSVPPPGGAARERWEALAALVQLAEEYAARPGPPPGLDEFCAELSRRAAQQHAPTVEGVTLASLHSAKGLEWDAVFLVGLADGTLPTPYAKTLEALEEERRLLYVGVTRARQWLWLSYAAARSPGGRPRKPSRFLPQLDRSAGPERAGGRATRRRAAAQVVSCRVCGTTLLAGADRKLGRCPGCPSDLDEELHERLLDWRSRTAGAQKVPAYVVFTDATLVALAERRPKRADELLAIAGIGPRKLGLYGPAVLALVDGAAVDAAISQNTSTRSSENGLPGGPGPA
jgi:DNA helicase II / ATP-dependent DNA helicase PcrA